MDEPSRLYKEVSFLTTIISLIAKRAPDFEGDGYLPGISDGRTVVDPLSLEESESSDDQADEQVEETDFEVAIGAADPGATLDALKRNALDRLAEVLARFKTARTQGKAKALDAKHVASVAMMADYNNKCLVIFCSKNDGLDPVDEKFLRRLGELLNTFSADGM